MSLLALTLAFSGLVALCLAMERHQVELNGARRIGPAGIRALRWGGWLLLVVAFGLSVLARGWGGGPIWWLGALTASGIGITYGLLPYRPRWVKPAAMVLPVVALVSMLLTSLG